MSKRVRTTIIILLVSLLLCACGGKTYRCAICMRQVTQVPHEVTVFEQEVEICDSCYNYLKVK